MKKQYWKHAYYIYIHACFYYYYRLYFYRFFSKERHSYGNQSIPYSKGWSAYVDGEKRDILSANVTYMALPLEPGNHHIVLKYRTPYLKEGCFISFIAFLLFSGILIYHDVNKV